MHHALLAGLSLILFQTHALHSGEQQHKDEMSMKYIASVPSICALKGYSSDGLDDCKELIKEDASI